MPTKPQIRSKKEFKAATKKAATEKAATKKAATGKAATKKAATKKAATNKTNKINNCQAKKEDDEDAREHEAYMKEKERKAAAKKKRKLAFDAQLAKLMDVMDQCLMVQWNSLHPSKPPPADLFVWKCKDML